MQIPSVARNLNCLPSLLRSFSTQYSNMYRETLCIDQLGLWARLNNIEFNGVKIAALQGDRGSGLVATAERSTNNPLLMTIPKDLVLSLENVWVYAKSDKHLHQILEATGEYTRVSGPQFFDEISRGSECGLIGVRQQEELS